MARQSKYITLTGTSPNSPGTAVTAAVSCGDFGSGQNPTTIKVIADLLGATAGVLDVYVQHSVDGGTTFYDCVHFTQLGAGAAAISYDVSPSKIGTTVPVVVGKATTPALGATLATPLPWGDQFRLLFVAGASTSLGAAQTVKLFFVTG